MEEIHLTCDVSGSFETKVCLDVKGVKSDSGVTKGRIEEMKGFYEKEADELADEAALQLATAREEIEYTAKTDTECDARIKGKAYHLAQVLIGLAGTMDFEIKKENKILSVRIVVPPRAAARFDKFKNSVNIKYAGKVLKTNAFKHDKANKIMTWNTKAETIEFAVQAPE
ncbi:hypothetical protein ACFL4W_05175 [Planctomycetota bacterium]